MKLAWHNRVFHRRVILGFALLLLVGSQAASASLGACPALFANKPASNIAAVSKSAADPKQMNEASREYLARLKYLVSERRLLNDQLLQDILLSPTPISPVANLPTSVQLYPHQVALAGLIQEDLQWKLIQAQVRSLVTTTTETRERTQSAAQETAKTFAPIEIRSFPFETLGVIKTESGQVVAVSARIDQRTRVGSLDSYDLPSGQLIGSTSLNFGAQYSKMSLIAIDQTVLATMPDEAHFEAVTIDLLNRNSLPLAKLYPSMQPYQIQRFTRDSGTEQTYFYKNNGQVEVAVFWHNNLHRFDALTGKPLRKIQISSQKTFVPARTGSIDGRLFVTDREGPSYVIDPTGQRATQKSAKIAALDVFQFQDKTFGIGLNAKAPMKGDAQVLKTVCFDSGDESRLFTLITRGNEIPVVRMKFEHDGTLLGVIDTSTDAYLVDLINGKILRKFSDANPVSEETPEWGSQIDGNQGFMVAGKPYLLATISTGPKQEDQQLVILDALTFEPVGSRYPLPSVPTSIRFVPGTGEDIQVMISFLDHSSRLYSLVRQ